MALPESYWHRYHNGVPKSIMTALRIGSHVKVLAQSVGQPKNPCEEIWLTIRHIKSKGKPNMNFVGQVNTKTGRSLFHGLEFGMLITFEPKHIIDVGLQRA